MVADNWVLSLTRMNSETKISIKSYRFGGREVVTKNEANSVEIEAKKGLFTKYISLSKAKYDKARNKEKPCKFWEQLPETV